MTKLRRPGPPAAIGIAASRRDPSLVDSLLYRCGVGTGGQRQRRLAAAAAALAIQTAPRLRAGVVARARALFVRNDAADQRRAAGFGWTGIGTQ